MSNEIEGRIDPFHYKGEFLELEKKLNSSKFVEFKEIIEIITKGETPLWRGDDYQKEGIPFLRVQNIFLDGIKGDLTFISEEVHKRMKRSQLNGGEILYTMAGSIGVATILPEDFGEANINQAIAKIIVKKEINKKYLISILNSNFCFRQAKRNLTTSAQPNINFEQIKSIKIPLPSPTIQNQIVIIMDKAYFQKKQKETEALNLLNSINDYVLDELGIKFTNIEEDKIYTINSEELESNRIDPYYFNPKFKRISSILEKNKLNLVSLKEISEKISNGKTPPKEDYADDGNLILKVNCLRNNKVLWYKLSHFKEGVPAVKTIKDKDILILSSAHQGEYLGRNPCIAEIPEEMKENNIYFVGEIISISVNLNKINPYYLLAILKLKEYYLLVNREKRGQTSHLYPVDLGKIKIPLPALSVQNQIADEVKKRMQKAEQLKKEAREELEKAKLEVEGIILGD